MLYTQILVNTEFKLLRYSKPEPFPQTIIKITSEVPGFVMLFTLFLSSILKNNKQTNQQKTHTKKHCDSTGVKASRRDQYSGMSMCLDGIHSR